MHDSRVSETPPSRILCQGDFGGCGACCGVYNDKDRKNNAAWERALREQTQRVTKANFDPEALKQIKTTFVQRHQQQRLYEDIRVCPFAGFVEENKIGCLIHPSRHPQQKDLRDLSVHSQKICAGHFCAAHDWLRPEEVAMINTCEGSFYGLLVSQVGLVKQLRACMESLLHRPLTVKDCELHTEGFQHLWRRIQDWPYASPNPQRFGAFVFIGAQGNSQSLPSCAALFEETPPTMWTQLLDELESHFDHPEQAVEGLEYVQSLLRELICDWGPQTVTPSSDR
tara:strand:- start:5661 stop:6509 length:849 start_codon:yes stop_codon:yes gene_type:complete